MQGSSVALRRGTGRPGAYRNMSATKAHVEDRALAHPFTYRNPYPLRGKVHHCTCACVSRRPPPSPLWPLKRNNWRLWSTG